MFQITHLIGALFSVAVAAIYGYVATRLSQRTISNPEARLAWQLFGLWWQILSRLIGLGAALGILCAYFPPGIIRRRFGVASISEQMQA